MRLTSLNDLVVGQRLIDGTWTLSRNHRVTYRRRGSNTVLLKGDIVQAEPAALVIRISERPTPDSRVSRLLSLRGRWQADDQNRLNFLAERQEGEYDRLTLSGSWELGKAQEILYRYRQTDLATKRKRLQTLTFRGAWDLAQGKELTYVLDLESNSAFRFRGTFETSSLLAKQGQIRYQMGVELAGGKRTLKTVTLFGKWKLSRSLTLDFDRSSS